MKTSVFTDFHLGTALAKDQAKLCSWVEDALTFDPDILIMAGDTFELGFALEHKKGISLHHSDKTLEQIISNWNQLFDRIQVSRAPQIVFIAGEHDYEILNPSLHTLLKERFPKKYVITTTHHYDTQSATLIIHGHELDYNRIFNINGMRISCIDGLTKAFQENLVQSTKIKKRVLDAVNNELFSFWYGTGSTSGYIKTCKILFDADEGVYEHLLAQVIRSKEVDLWLSCQHSTPMIKSFNVGVNFVF